MSTTPIESLETILDRYTFGVFIFTPEETENLIRVPSRIGIKDILSKSESPLKSSHKFLSLIESANEVSLVGTALTDLSDLLKDEQVHSEVKSRIFDDKLRLEIIIIDPSCETYLQMRSREIDSPTFSTTHNLRECYWRFMNMKESWLREASTKQQHCVRKNLIVATHKQLPRAAFMKFDEVLFFRPYTGLRRGGSSHFLLELDGTTFQTDNNVYDIYTSEFNRVRENALGSLLPVSVDLSGEEWNEHREIVHRLGIVHYAVHLLCANYSGDLYLQLRSSNRARNHE